MLACLVLSYVCMYVVLVLSYLGLACLVSKTPQSLARACGYSVECHVFLKMMGGFEIALRFLLMVQLHHVSNDSVMILQPFCCMQSYLAACYTFSRAVFLNTPKPDFLHF